MPDPITYFDDRTGDKYVVFRDESGDFAHAQRYLDRVGCDPIPYERLADLPSCVRGAIESVLCQK